VIPGRGSQTPGPILVIRWRLPSGTEIDTGFRGEDRSGYAAWTSSGDDNAPSSCHDNAPSSGDDNQIGDQA
jgi:hypothetical protein